MAEIAAGGKGERFKGAEGGDAGEGEHCGGWWAAGAWWWTRGCTACGWSFVSEGQKRMRTRTTLVYAVVAETPVAVVAYIAAPPAIVGPGEAARAEIAAFETVDWIVVCKGTTTGSGASGWAGGKRG